MTPADLRAWQSHMHMTYDTAAHALGVSRATYAAWVNGHTGISKITALACAALAAGLKPWGA